MVWGYINVLAKAHLYFCNGTINVWDIKKKKKNTDTEMLKQCGWLFNHHLFQGCLWIFQQNNTRLHPAGKHSAASSTIPM